MRGPAIGQRGAPSGQRGALKGQRGAPIGKRGAWLRKEGPQLWKKGPRTGEDGPWTGQRGAPNGQIGAPQRVRRGFKQGLGGRQLCQCGAPLCLRSSNKQLYQLPASMLTRVAFKISWRILRYLQLNLFSIAQQMLCLFLFLILLFSLSGIFSNFFAEI